MTEWTRNPASFRDPSGFVFNMDGVLYRQVNQLHAPQYDHLMSSGLYEELTDIGPLVQHDQVPLRVSGFPEARAVLRPTPVAFIRYPYDRMFTVRPDVIPEFHEDAFEESAERVFRIVDRQPVRESCRTLYLTEAT